MVPPPPGLTTAQAAGDVLSRLFPQALKVAPASIKVFHRRLHVWY
uniref:Uncharacterized protein n=1 Tax=Dulem virus 32 TaxID=3145750 RepID=A0AAU8B1N0_9CAUD